MSEFVDWRSGTAKPVTFEGRKRKPLNMKPPKPKERETW